MIMLTRKSKKSKNIWTACLEGYPNVLKELLKGLPLVKNGKYKVNSLRDNHNWTPLHHAAKGHCKECVSILLQSTNISPMARCYEENTALHVACESRAPLDVVRLLVERECKMVNMVNTFEIAPLHLAVTANRLDIVEYLVENGAKVDRLDYSGETALHMAVMQGYLDIVIYLLFIAKADAGIRLENGQNILEALACHPRQDHDVQIAIFTILFNYLHPEHEYRQIYKFADILNIGFWSNYAKSWLAYHFIQTNYLGMNGYKNSKAHFMRDLDYAEEYPYYCVMLLLHDHMKPEYIKTIKPHLVEDFLMHWADHVAMSIQSGDCEILLQTIPEAFYLFQNLDPFLEYFVRYFAYMDFTRLEGSVYDVFKESIRSIVTCRGVATADHLFGLVLAVKNWRNGRALYDNIAEMCDAIVPFCTPNIFVRMRGLEKSVFNAKRNIFLRYGTLQLLKQLEIEFDGEKLVDFNQFSLKRQSRDVIRERIFNSIPDNRKQSAKQCQEVFLNKISSLDIPKNLLDYLRYI